MNVHQNIWVLLLKPLQYYGFVTYVTQLLQIIYAAPIGYFIPYVRDCGEGDQGFPVENSLLMSCFPLETAERMSLRRVMAHRVAPQYCSLNKLGTGYINHVIPSAARNLKISPGNCSGRFLRIPAPTALGHPARRVALPSAIHGGRLRSK